MGVAWWLMAGLLVASGAALTQPIQPLEPLQAHAHCEQTYGGKDEADYGKPSWDCTFEGRAEAHAANAEPAAQKPSSEPQTLRAWAGPFFIRLVDDPTAVLTLVLAFATAVLAFFTVRLAGATDKLVIGADNTARRQLRAYVHLEGLETPPPTATCFLEAPITIRNFGQTPAHNATIAVDWDIAPFPFDEKIFRKAPSRHVSRQTIAPGSKIFTFVRVDAVPPQDRLLAIRRATEAFWIIIRIDYEDEFGQLRNTNIRAFSCGMDFERRAFAYDTEGNAAT